MMHASCSIKHEPADFFERAGFEVLIHTPYHYQLKRHDALVDWWPTKNKFMAFGQVFKSTPQRLVEGINSGAIAMPADTRPVNCRRCGRPVFLVRSKKASWFPVEANGINHIVRCRGRK